MRIKIKRHTAVCGGSEETNRYRKTLRKLEGRWVEVETEFMFQNQYNTGPVPGSVCGLRVFGENVEKIDYQGDKVLEAVHKAMQAGKIQCHSYLRNKGEFADLHGNIPTDVSLALLQATATP